MTIGILSLQGAVSPHIRHISSLSQQALRIRTEDDLRKIERLIIPGGESTTMLRLLKSHRLIEPIIEFGKSRPVWGVCAGAILLAKKVFNPTQDSLGLCDIFARRNFYGNQTDSFTASVRIEALSREMECDFIRAPDIEPCQDSAEVLAEYAGRPVLIRDKNILVSSFHTELRDDPGLHEFFLGF
jgi:5'-phosphate synthase pdxT subunit